VVYLVHRGRETVVPLPVTLLIVFDFLANHSRLPQSAPQIAMAIHSDPFYIRHGANANGTAKLTRTINKSAVKECVKRIRQTLGRVFPAAGLALDPVVVLASEETATNQVGYRLRATVEWLHVDHPDPSSH